MPAHRSDAAIEGKQRNPGPGGSQREGEAAGSDVQEEEVQEEEGFPLSEVIRSSLRRSARGGEDKGCGGGEEIITLGRNVLNLGVAFFFFGRLTSFSHQTRDSSSCSPPDTSWLSSSSPTPVWR